MPFLDILLDEHTLVLSGLTNTLILFLAASIIGLLLACAGLYVLELKNKFFTAVVIGFTGLMRMTPFLAIAYVLFYGLPQLGIRMEAWTAGLLTLTIYHGAYFTEILRSTRVSLPKGDIEAAQSLGLSSWRCFRDIVLPQSLLRSRLLLGNQFIVCLKDTSFLSIITVVELTSVANTLSGNYLMVLQPFLMVILCYWVITLIIEIVIKQLGSLGIRRGLEHG